MLLRTFEPRSYTQFISNSLSLSRGLYRIRCAEPRYRVQIYSHLRFDRRFFDVQTRYAPSHTIPGSSTRLIWVLDMRLTAADKN